MWIVMVVAAARVGDARVEKLSVKIKSTITSAVLASRVRKISPCPLNAWRHSPSTIQPTVSGSAVEVTRRKEQGLPRCRAQQDRRCRPKAEAAAEVLSGIVPDADFSWGVQSVGMPELEGIFSDSLDSEDQEDLVDLDVEGSILCPEELADRVLSSDVILSGVDNLRSRAIISGIASSLNKKAPSSTP